MKRVLIALVIALPLALGAGVAQAHPPGNWGQWDDNGGGQSSASVVAVAGTVTSVDPAANSFTANAFIPSGNGSQDGSDDQGSSDQGSSDQGDSGDQGSSDQGSSGQGDSGDQGDSNGTAGPATPGQGAGHQGDFRSDWLGNQPALTPVTITTDPSATRFRVDGQNSTLSDLAPGDRFVALFNGSPSDSLQTLVSQPALAVDAQPAATQHQLYAFVGTVSGVDTAAGTLTVQVSNSIPSGLVPAGSNPATFTVPSSTMILGGSSTNGLYGGSLSDVSAGDVVAGGLIGPAGETLSQVESSPLQVLVDFPATATPVKTAALRRAARQRALSQALALFGYKTKSHTTTGNGHKVRRGKTHAHHGRSGTSRTRSHARRT
jgi:hypothetical protein